MILEEQNPRLISGICIYLHMHVYLHNIHIPAHSWTFTHLRTDLHIHMYIHHVQWLISMKSLNTVIIIITPKLQSYTCPYRNNLLISLCLLILTQVHCHTAFPAAISCLFFFLTASVGESSEETPLPEVPNAFHSAMSVEAALDLLVTHLTHGQVPCQPTHVTLS